MSTRIRWLAIVGLLSLFHGAAYGQAARTFVSPTGNDVNSCSLSAPCRTFAGAIGKTNAGGEIAVLGTAGYGAVTITKAISITNQTGEAAILAGGSGTIGITISAASTDPVHLVGLIIDGVGTGDTGVQFNTGLSLNVQNCIIRGFTNKGIDFKPNASATLVVANTVVSDNPSTSVDPGGIMIFPTGSNVTVNAVLNRLQVDNNQNGIVVRGLSNTGTVNATIFDSVVSNNKGYGVLSQSNTGQAATNVFVRSSALVNNSQALYANQTNAYILLASSLVAGNANGWVANSGAVLQSDGLNNIEGNGGNQGPPPLAATK
jgi:hypothetical protein